MIFKKQKTVKIIVACYLTFTRISCKDVVKSERHFWVCAWPTACSGSLICGGLLRHALLDVCIYASAPARLAAHPHLKLPLHAVVHSPRSAQLFCRASGQRRGQRYCSPFGGTTGLIGSLVLPKVIASWWLRSAMRPVLICLGFSTLED
jgi:hypothetical protein